MGKTINCVHTDKQWYKKYKWIFHVSKSTEISHNKSKQNKIWMRWLPGWPTNQAGNHTNHMSVKIGNKSVKKSKSQSREYANKSQSKSHTEYEGGDRLVDQPSSGRPHHSYLKAKKRYIDALLRKTQTSETVISSAERNQSLEASIDQISRKSLQKVYTRYQVSLCPWPAA